jgi:hypothetical protein
MVVSNSSTWQEESKSTRVTQFPKTSCIHLISTGSGVTLSWQSNKRWSKLSRGRNINWCGPSLTGCLYWYVVVWCTVKTVISCPISKITLCSDFMARETQGCRAKYTATAAIFSMLTVAWLGTFLRSSASLESDEEFDFEDSSRLRHHVQLHSAGSYAADAARSSLSAVRFLCEDKIEFSPKVQARDFKDAFGNICTRLVAPTGLLEIRNEFIIADSGQPDIVATDAEQWPIDPTLSVRRLELMGQGR